MEKRTPFLKTSWENKEIKRRGDADRKPSRFAAEHVVWAIYNLGGVT
jgi:hypothetical protein